MGYNSVADTVVYDYEDRLSIFVRSAVVGSQIYEIPWNSERIRTYSS